MIFYSCILHCTRVISVKFVRSVFYDACLPLNTNLYVHVDYHSNVITFNVYDNVHCMLLKERVPRVERREKIIESWNGCVSDFLCFLFFWIFSNKNIVYNLKCTSQWICNETLHTRSHIRIQLETHEMLSYGI